MAEQPSEPMRFKAWANDKGYDTAHTYDTERSRWVFFNPMTADLWESWRAALSQPSTAWTHEINQELERQYLKGFQAGKAFEREQCAKAVESLEAKLPSLEDYEDTGAYLVWEVSQKHDDRWIEQPIAAAAIRSRKDAP